MTCTTDVSKTDGRLRLFLYAAQQQIYLTLKYLIKKFFPLRASLCLFWLKHLGYNVLRGSLHVGTADKIVAG